MATSQELAFRLTASDAASGVISKLTGGLRQAEAAAAGVAATFGNFGVALTGAAVAGGLSAFVRSTTAGLDALNDLKDATGASIENISALEDVAARTGTSFDTVGTALINLNKALKDAKPGDDIERAFKNLGLSVAELRTLDPAEALRRTAAAFAGFADGPTKAQYFLELFKKSTREVAPLLNDLAKQSELVATVTTRQAEEAERFNQQLDSLAKNAKDAGRALVSSLLPALNDVLAEFKALNAGPGVAAGFLEFVKGRSFTDAKAGFEFYKKAIDEIDQKLANLSKSSAGNGFARLNEPKRRAELEKERKDLESFLEVYRKVINAQGAGAGAGRGSVNPVAAPKLPDIGGNTKKLKEARVAFEDYAATITQSIARLAEETQTAKLAKLNAQLAELDRLAAAGLDPTIVADVRTALEGLQTVEIPKETVEAMRQVRDILAQTPTGQLDALVELESILNAANLPAEQLAEALAVLDERFEKLIPTIDETEDQLSDFARRAGENIQDALGDTLLQVLEGDFKSIGRLWESLLNRMVAQAIAVRLNEALFGQNFNGGAFGPALSGLLGVLGGSTFGAGAGAANGQWDVLPPAASAGTTIINNVAAGVSRAEVLALLNQASSAADARVAQRLQRAGV